MLDDCSESRFEEALKIISDPLYNPENDGYDLIASVIRNLDIFQKNFGSTTKLDMFLDLARWHLNYEVHNHGTVLIKEQDYADRVYIILKGSVQILQQKSSGEVEQEVQETERRNSFLARSDVLAPSLSNIQRGRSRNSSWTDLNKKRTQTPERIEKPVEIVGIENLVELTDKSEESEKQENKRVMLNKFLSIEAPTPRPRKSLFVDINPSNPSINDVESEASNSPMIREIISVNQATSPAMWSLTSFNGRERGRRNSSMLRQKQHSESRRPSIFEMEKMREQEREADEIANFVKTIVKKHPDIAHRCLRNDTVRLKKTKVLNVGDFLGENFCRHNQLREQAIFAVASEEVHVLTITRESYQKIFEEVFNNTNSKVIFFRRWFSSFPDHQVIEFSQQFNQKSYKKSDVVYHQSDSADEFFFIQSGGILLSKENEPNSPGAQAFLSSNKYTKKKDFPVVTVSENQFFGDEIILEEAFRQYTATISIPDTELYVLSSETYQNVKEKFKMFFVHLKKQALERVEWRQGRVNELNEQNQLTKSIMLDTPRSFRKSPLQMVSNHYDDEVVVTLPDTKPSRTSLSQQLPLAITQNDSNTASPITKSRKRVKVKVVVPKSNVESPVVSRANSDLYKIQFARTIMSPKRFKNSITLLDLKEKESVETLHHTESSSKIELSEFNIRKQLEELPQSKQINSRTLVSKTSSSTNDSSSPKKSFSLQNKITPLTSNRTPVQKQNPITHVNSNSMSKLQKLSKFSFLPTVQMQKIGTPLQKRKKAPRMSTCSTLESLISPRSPVACMTPGSCNTPSASMKKQIKVFLEGVSFQPQANKVVEKKTRVTSCTNFRISRRVQTEM